jgi:hypothetical protein
MIRSIVAFAGLVVGLVGFAAAQGMRDPTVPPDGVGQASAGAPISRPASIEGGAFTIIVRNGVPSLVVGTRLYVRGQKLGNATIERIAETEVWLREGRVVRKVSQFQGIERKITSTASPAKPKTAPHRCGKTATSSVSCANDKP